MKKILYSFGMLTFAMIALSNQSSAALQCSSETNLPSVLTEDACFYDNILLNELEYPEDLNERPQNVTAEVVGSGTLVLKAKQNAGFPRIIILGDTTVTNYQYEPLTGNTNPWNGEVAIPYPTRLPNRSNFFEEGSDIDEGENTSVEIIGGYQLGPDYDAFEFSNDTFLSFYVNRPDGTQVWYATEIKTQEEIIEDREIMNDIQWQLVDEDYCIVSDSICTIKIEKDSAINRVALVRPLQDSCPAIRIENGSFSGAPECSLICDEGYGFDFDTKKCIPSSDLKAQEDLTDKDDYVSSLAQSRQGYFRFRDSRGGQLEKEPGAEDLSSAEQQFVDTKNAAVNGRLGSTEESVLNSNSVSKDSLWKQFQELVWTNDTTGEYHISRNTDSSDAASESVEIGSLGESAEGSSESFSASTGGLLPSTGSGAFIALLIAGLATMGFALRKRRP